MIGNVAADLAAFTVDFGTDAQVGGVTVRGLFDNGYGEAFDVAATRPSLLCRSGDVSTAAHGTAVSVDAVSYKICGIEPDGTGLTRLRLERQ